jgi:site-specific recombinase XerD
METIEQTLVAFLTDRKAQRLSPKTIKTYTYELYSFREFMDSRDVTGIDCLNPSDIREYMLFLADKGRNPGGQYVAYRTIKTWLFWWELEVEGFTAPIRKVKAPRLDNEPLEPVSMEHVKLLIGTCDRTFYGNRDRAMILILIDTGVRAQALLNIDVDNLNLTLGTIHVVSKGRKPRTLYIGRQTRRTLRAYLNIHRGTPALFTAYDGVRLTYSGLRLMLMRKSQRLGLPIVTPHQFRRAFALSMLRQGVNIYTLANLMGHSDTRMLERYLKLIDTDMESAHRQHSPGDRLK